MIVELSNGRVMHCDREDYLRFCLESDFSALHDNGEGYAYFTQRQNRKTIRFYFHRWVLGCTILDVEHINGNSLDNRRCNLRIVPRGANKRNLNDKLTISNISGTRGIAWKPDSKKWHARIMVDYKAIHLGLFDSKEAAIRARVKAEKEYEFTQKMR